MAKEISHEEPETAFCGAAATGRTVRPRDRIMATAQAMFHRHGFRGVGVEAIAEAAGTNKMTLYRHFGSKDDLIVACLKRALEDVEAVWAAMEAANPGDPCGQLRDWVKEVSKYLASDERGFDLANAVVELTEWEHPARYVIEDFKIRQRIRLTELCRAAGAADPNLLADTLYLLKEGARVTRRSVGAEGPCAGFACVCETIFDSFGVRRSSEEETIESAEPAR
jgi:AcrR family transcriptional regulator